MSKPIARPAKPARKTRHKATKPPVPRKIVERFVWRGIVMTATHTPDYISTGWSHVELRVVKPKGAPLPITTTGYLSHFLDGEQLAAAGGPAAFFLAWIEREATSKAYRKALASWQQLDLFAKH